SCFNDRATVPSLLIRPHASFDDAAMRRQRDHATEPQIGDGQRVPGCGRPILLTKCPPSPTLSDRPIQQEKRPILLTTHSTLPIVSDTMPRTFQRPFPAVAKQMAALGQRMKLARLRRSLSSVLFAERVGVSRDTLHRLEKGDPTIALGTYLRALRVLGLDKDLE